MAEKFHYPVLVHVGEEAFDVCFYNMTDQPLLDRYVQSPKRLMAAQEQEYGQPVLVDTNARSA